MNICLPEIHRLLISSLRTKSQPSHKIVLETYCFIEICFSLRFDLPANFTSVRMFNIEWNKILTFSITQRTHFTMAYILQTTSKRTNTFLLMRGAKLTYMYGKTALDAMTVPLRRTGCVRASKSACEVFDDTRNLSSNEYKINVLDE